MMTILAQIETVSGGDVKNWLLVALCAVSLAALIKTAFIRKPSIEAEFVTKAEFEQHKDRIYREIRLISEKVDALPMELSQLGERRAQAIHERINELDRLAGRLEGILSRMES